ncbi:MAG TPA: serine hydrolase [Thermoanaerobaculia bacterium]|nr:serine hydrolase [Thermoanaerobaculia bacterium]
MNPRNPGPGMRILGASLLMLALAAVSAVAAPPSNDELVRYADAALAANYPADGPGAAALVVRDGEVLLRKGYGLAELELGVPIQPDMVFEIGSVTKQFTAAAILMLEERGLLSVEDEVTKHLPDYPTHGAKITIDHLLTHVSGIPSYTGLPEWIPRVREDITLEQLIGLFKDKPLEFQPGERWAYNNSAYILLGAVIEKVSGKTYEEFVEGEIFAPLGMKRSRYGSQSEVIPGRAEGYGRDENGFRRAAYLSMTQPYSAGALFSTVDDLWRWEQGLASGRLLRPRTLERMFTPIKLNSGANAHYAYGWNTFEYGDRKVIEHGGDIFGFSSHVVRVPEEKLYVAILSNNPGAERSPEDLGLGIAAKAIGAAFEERPALALDPKVLDEYVAVYRFDAATTRAITHENGKLYSQRNGGAKAEIAASAKDELFFRDSAARLRFRRDATGKVIGLDFLASMGVDGYGVRTDEPLPSERQAVKVDSALFDVYAGSYELAPGFNLVVTREGDQLFVQPTGQSKAELFAQSELEFFLKVADVRITFERPADGKASGLVLHQAGRDVPAKRVE